MALANIQGCSFFSLQLNFITNYKIRPLLSNALILLTKFPPSEMSLQISSNCQGTTQHLSKFLLISQTIVHHKLESVSPHFLLQYLISVCWYS